jgi:methionyl-tRNA synthetase
MTEQQLIVPSNPTPNGDLHIGHIAGPLIGADILRRACAQRGEAAAVLLGTAWQNSHVLLAARQQGRGYLEVAAEFAGLIERSLDAAGIGHHVMLRHSDIPDIEQATRAAFARLRADGAVVIREARAHYCTSCDEWRFQGYVDGRCPYCDSTDAYGIDCEGCGVYHDDAELLDAHCAVCGTPTALRPLARAFLDLERQRPWFERYLAETALGTPVRAFAEAVLSRRLRPVAVTFAGEVGFPAGDDLPGQRIYPSFELAPRYTVMVRRLRAASPGTCAKATTSMLFGYDNAFERVFLFPAVLRGLSDPGAPQPSVMQMTYFYLLDGVKFSTSRRHVVSVQEMVGAHGLDTTRLYLAATRPEEGTSNFSSSAVARSPQARVVYQLRTWADTGRLPQGGHCAGDARARLVAAAADLDQALRAERLSCSRAAHAVVRLAKIAESAQVAADPALLKAVLHCLVNGAAALIPDTAARLGAALSVAPTTFDGLRDG